MTDFERQLLIELKLIRSSLLAIQSQGPNQRTTTHLNEYNQATAKIEHEVAELLERVDE